MQRLHQLIDRLIALLADRFVHLYLQHKVAAALQVEIGALQGSRKLVNAGRAGFAFAATTVTIASCIVAIFTGLYPNVMVSTTNAAYNLTVHNNASGNYTLKVMTVIAIVTLPVVLAYQTWSYYVFRKRVSKQEFQASPAPSSAPASAQGTRPQTATPGATAAPAD